MKKRVQKAYKETRNVQLSLFDSDLRELTDRELIAKLTKNAEKVAEEWEWTYSMEKLYNQLTPHCRRIAAAAVELYRRRETRKRSSQAIRSSQDIFQTMLPIVGDLEVEEFWVLPLSHSMRLIQPIRISIGGIACTLADVRVVFRKLLEVGATSFAVVHNHPSGQVLPSAEDNRLTNILARAADVMNMRLIDHLIIGSGSFFSYMDEGKL